MSLYYDVWAQTSSREDVIDWWDGEPTTFLGWQHNEPTLLWMLWGSAMEYQVWLRMAIDHADAKLLLHDPPELMSEWIAHRLGAVFHLDLFGPVGGNSRILLEDKWPLPFVPHGQLALRAAEHMARTARTTAVERSRTEDEEDLLAATRQLRALLAQ